MCHGCDDVFGRFAGVLRQERFDIGELVSDVVELFVKLVAVVIEPVLYDLEQVGGKVLLVALWIAVFCDVIKPSGDEFLVVLGRDGEGSSVEPSGGPGDGVEEHSFVFVVFLWIREKFKGTRN